MKIMVFLQGTVIMHESGLGKTPEERRQQVEQSEKSIFLFENYIPVDNANEKLKTWVTKGAEIVYLSSHQNEKNMEKDKLVLEKYRFPEALMLYRQEAESYTDIVEKIMPNILIEDDCESIGGKIEMTFPHLSNEKKKVIKSIVVPEFSGIDKLPDDLTKLVNY